MSARFRFQRPPERSYQATVDPALLLSERFLWTMTTLQIRMALALQAWMRERGSPAIARSVARSSNGMMHWALDPEMQLPTLHSNHQDKQKLLRDDPP
jgi:hypothetical protein